MDLEALQDQAWAVVADVMQDEFADNDTRLLCARVILGNGADRHRDELLLKAVNRLIELAEELQQEARCGKPS